MKRIRLFRETEVSDQPGKCCTVFKNDDSIYNTMGLTPIWPHFTILSTIREEQKENVDRDDILSNG